MASYIIVCNFPEVHHYYFEFYNKYVPTFVDKDETPGAVQKEDTSI